jgi:DMSO/TMAO reductase YedYZ molybdopterin-dependent catalytic subunit
MRTRIKLTLLSVLTTAILIIAAYAITRPSHEPSDQVEISVSGLVDKPFNITLWDIRSLPNTTVVSELICVDGQSLGIHSWTGVKLKELLNEGTIQEGAVKVAFFADDGYSTDLTVQDATRDDVLVAYLQDGSAIPENTKLVVPGKWGYKWISGITEVRVLDYNYMGFWEGRGYSDDATITG